MANANLTNINTPAPLNSSLTVMNNILRVIKNGIIAAQVANGVTNPVAPDVGPASLAGLLARGVGNEVANATAYSQAAFNLQMPDTATGANLNRWLNIYNIPRRNASSSFGTVVGTTSPTSASTFIPAGTQLTAPSGTRYQVQTSGTYGNGSTIPLIAIDTGSITNQEVGVTLQWVSTPAYFSSTVTVNNALEGGVDAETDGVADSRLLAFFANPPSSGNPSQVIQNAGQSSTDVQTAFVYPAARLGATVDVTVVTAATSTSTSRALSTPILTNVVGPYISGLLPTSIDCLVTTVVDYPIDVCLFLSLPLAPTANPPGPGGGWLDPNPLVTTAAKPFIRVVDGYALSGNTSGVPQNTSNAFWVDVANYANSAPVQGFQYNFSYLSPTDLTLYQGTTNGTFTQGSNYASLSGYPSLYYLTFNNPFYDNATLGTVVKPGAVIFPSAAKTATYIQQLLAYLTTLGPGERTNNPLLTSRALRQPPEATAYNYKINDRVVKPVLNNPEVYDGTLNYLGIYCNSGFTPVPNGESITPSTLFVPYNTITTNADTAYAASAPPTAFLANGNSALGPSYIFVINNLAIYPLF
jgi:hypothetical protein